MDTIYDKLTYLRGLCDGAGFTEDTKEGKVFQGILDVLDELTTVVDSIYEDASEEFEEEEDEETEEEEKERKSSYSYAFVCPACGEEFEVDESVFDREESLYCPACDTEIPVGGSTEELS